MWNLPGPGIEPISPALADRFLPTVPPGQSRSIYLLAESGLSCSGRYLSLWHVGSVALENPMDRGAWHAHTVHRAGS